jgi:acetoin utilization deacetylase AcuC-like enzyme
MKQTGIFFHDLCRDKDIDWLLRGRLLSFPRILEDMGILKEPNIHFLESPRVSDDLLKMVHTKNMIKRVSMTPYYETALRSTGGTVEGARKIAVGEIDNAFVFTGSADHHAGKDHFWGGCHFNGAALAIAYLKEKKLMQRFAIIDTDHHHGDGTRNIFSRDKNVLHVCFCSRTDYSSDRSKVDIRNPYPCKDETYVDLVQKECVPLMLDFKPEIIFWEFGYDNTKGDYGDIGLTQESHLQIFNAIQQVSEEICRGYVIVILCGGSSRQTADFCIPQIISRLAGLQQSS